MSSKSTPAYRNNRRIGWASWIKEHTILLKLRLSFVREQSLYDHHHFIKGPPFLVWAGSFLLYYPPEETRGKYCWLEVFLLQYSPLVSVCIIVHHKCMKKSWVVKIRNTSEAVLGTASFVFTFLILNGSRSFGCWYSDFSLKKESRVVHQDGSSNPGSRKPFTCPWLDLSMIHENPLPPPPPHILWVSRFFLGECTINLKRGQVKI